LNLLNYRLLFLFYTRPCFVEGNFENNMIKLGEVIFCIIFCNQKIIFGLFLVNHL